MKLLTIRSARQDDSASLKTLWVTAFGEPEYGDFFLTRGVLASSGLVVEEDDAIAAMLWLLPVAVQQEFGMRRGNYVYAVATDPAYRGRGYMGRLLQAAEEQTLREGGDFLTLVPASPSLFELYARYGFSVCTTKRKTTRTVCAKHVREEPVIECPLEEYLHLRKIKTPSMLTFTGKAAQYQQEEAAFTGLRTFYFPQTDGYAALFAEETLDVREVLGTISETGWQTLMKKLQTPTAQIREVGGNVPYAMARSLTHDTLGSFDQSLMFD